MEPDTPITIAQPSAQTPADDPAFLADQSSPTITPTPELANTRAQKAYVGLGKATGMSQADFQQQIQAGQEDLVRQTAASTLNFQRSQAQNQQLIDARNKKGSALSLQEAYQIIDPYNPVNGNANPDDVIERAYSESVLGTASTANVYMRDTTLAKGEQDIPAQTELAKQNTSNLLTSINIARTLQENINNEVHQQGWVPFLADQAKSLFQPYVEYKLRGLDPDVGSVTGGLLLGTNLKAQADDLITKYASNPPVFQQKLTEIVSGVRRDNPSLASKFLDYVVGNSTNDRILDNIFTMVAPLDAASLVKGGAGLVRAAELNNRVNTAFKQIVQEAAKVDPSVPVKAVAEEAVGDVKSAGATRAADHITKALSGSLDPVQDIKESLTSNFRLDGDLIDSNPGKLSAQETTELKNSFYSSGSDLYDRVVNMLRVNRTPVPLASEDAIRSYQDAARAANTQEGLLDIGSPIKESASNTYWVAHTFGNADGRLFSDAETAYNYARARGYADPRILEASGEVEKEAAKAIGTKTDLANVARLRKTIPQDEEFMASQKAKLKDMNSKKFVGPVRPEDKASLQQYIKDFGETIEGKKSQLAKLEGKITYTDPVIEQSGIGYKFTVLRPYNETDDIIRSYLTSDAKARSSASQTGWSSWKNSFLGWVRSSDDTLAFNDSLNRKVATYTQTVMHQWAKAEAKEIEVIANQSQWYKPWTYARKFTNREQFEQFNSVLKYAKTADDPATGLKGYFFKTPGELTDHYQRFYQRIPSFQEVKAYFAHVKLVEGNRVLSEIAEFRNRARLGVEQHQVFTQLADGSRKASGFFDGVERKEFPNGGGQIVIMGGRDGEERLYHLGANEIPGKDIARYRDLVSKGQAKIIEIFDPDTHPLAGFLKSGNERIRYMLVTDAESKPIGFNHVNRRGGGHFDYDATHYIKQANVVDEAAGDALSDKRRVFKRIYTGDNTLMAGSGVKTQDEFFAKSMTQMNTLMRESRTEEAKALARKIGIDWDTVDSWYDQNRFVNGKRVGAKIDWNEPFYVVPRNRRILDVDTKGLQERVNGGVPDRFQDASKSGSLAKQFQVEYNQARDSDGLLQLRDVGTQGNPVYKMEQAAFVDPIPTLNRALNRAIRSTFMDDYKIQAVEHWLAEASPYLKASTEEIRSAPFYHFNNADDGAFTAAAPFETKQNLLSNRFKIKQFIGVPNTVETSIHSLTQNLVDSFYNKFGPEESRNALQKAVTIVPLWALSKWQDPISGLRSFAFNAKLGVFALPQFLVQAQTFANIWALGGRAAGAGTYATMLHQWARVNASEAFLRAYDDYATKLNVFGSRWRPGEFIEARNELAKTGFEHVGHEYQLADDTMQHKFIKNDWNNFLDAGQVFFREGEQATRLGAWYTAFREFRDVNPTKVLTDADRAGILQKADLYTVNMSRASAGAYNSGLFSLPMQFLTYQVRMAELFWGKRLGETLAERTANRARLLGVYAAMYGAPGALGVAGLPFQDSIREAAVNKGYVPGADMLTDGIMNGLIATQLALISGKGDYKKGTQYDVQGRWGNQGLTAIQETMRSDKSVWSLVGGAGLDTFGSTVMHFADPFWQFARQLITDDEEGNTFKLTPAHFSALFSEISSVDLATRGIYALHTGRWITKNEAYVEDVTASDVLWREISGIKTQDQTDINTFRNIKQDEENAQKAAQTEIIKDYHRGLDAVRDKDYDTANTYFTNARARIVASGMPLDKRAQIFAAASRGFEAQTLTSQWNWATKNVPYTPGTQQTRLDALQRRQQLQTYRSDARN